MFSLLFGAALAAEDFEDLTYWVGDLHVHTGVSADGESADIGEGCDDCGAFAGIFQLAVSNGLDFVSITDHMNGDWAAAAVGWDLVWSTQLGPTGSELVVVPGGELVMGTSAGQPLGHKNVYFFGENEQLADVTFADLRWNGDSIELDACEDTWSYAENLSDKAGPLVLVPHHPAGASPMPVDWSCHSDTWQPATEIYSRHGDATESDGAFDPPMSGVVETGTIEHALDPFGEALRFGFLGATDSHDTAPGLVCRGEGDTKYGGGLTLVVQDAGEELTRSSIHSAILERRTIATSGPVLPVAVTYRSGDEELGTLGDDFELTVDEPFDVEVRMPAAVAPNVLAVELVTPAEVVEVEGGGGVWTHGFDHPPLWVYVRVRVDGEAWYATIGGCPDGGETTEERLWLSPSWNLADPPIDTGDSGSSGDSGAGDSGPGDSGPTDSPHTADTSRPDSGPKDSGGPEVRLEPGGCGCGGGAAVAGLLLVPLALRRRR